MKTRNYSIALLTVLSFGATSPANSFLHWKVCTHGHAVDPKIVGVWKNKKRIRVFNADGTTLVSWPIQVVPPNESGMHRLDNTPIPELTTNQGFFNTCGGTKLELYFGESKFLNYLIKGDELRFTFEDQDPENPEKKVERVENYNRGL